VTRLRSTLYGVAVALAILGAAEGAARIVEIWHTPAPVDEGLGFDAESRLFVPARGDPARRRTAVEKVGGFHEQWFSAQKAPGSVRLVAVGESSVYNLQSEFARLAERLGGRWGRPVEVINGGGNAYGSQRLVAVTRELVDYQPDVVLLYLGHNEFEEVEQLELVSLRLVGVERAASHLALFRLARDWLTAARVRRLTAARHKLNTGVDSERAWAHAWTPEEAEARMHAFRRNVSDMVELCAARGVKVVMATIPSNRWKPALPGAQAAISAELVELHARGAFAYSDVLARQALRDAIGRHQSSDVENQILREIAAGYGVVLVDVEAAVVAAEPHHVPGETLFADHCHLNADGNRVWAQAFEAALAPLTF
jgi:lysophospholipase L1-like esterase